MNRACGRYVSFLSLVLFLLFGWSVYLPTQVLATADPVLQGLLPKTKLKSVQTLSPGFRALLK